MKTGIIFDLDGTLLDTLEDLLDATNYALGQFGFPGRTLPELRKFVGNGAQNQIRLSLPEETDSEWVSRVLAVYKPYYTAHCQVKTVPYEGILPQLTLLAGKYPLAIVSNKPDLAVKALCAEYFPGIFALGEAPECPRKPAPDMVYRAMAQIGVETCVYVGDSEVDVLTARNAGIPCLSVLWGFRDKGDLEKAGADHFCEKTSDLAEKIEQLCRISMHKG